jgi:PD-(D/E)XK nuclease superfamily protein
MVNYALFIKVIPDSPHADLQAATVSVRQRRAGLLEASISHTSFGPLNYVPICVSIETKRPGRDDKEAFV